MACDLFQLLLSFYDNQHIFKCLHYSIDRRSFRITCIYSFSSFISKVRNQTQFDTFFRYFNSWRHLDIELGSTKLRITYFFWTIPPMQVWNFVSIHPKHDCKLIVLPYFVRSYSFGYLQLHGSTRLSKQLSNTQHERAMADDPLHKSEWIDMCECIFPSYKEG